MPTSLESSTNAVGKVLAKSLFDGAAFFANILTASIAGWILGVLTAVLLESLLRGGGLFTALLDILFFCFPAFCMGYVALHKFDQNTAKWTWAAGLLIWVAVVSIDLATFDGKYCGLNRWEHLWADYIFPGAKGKTCIDEGLGWLFVTAPMLCNVAYSLGAMLALRQEADEQ
jgi:hypothetical protein